MLLIIAPALLSATPLAPSRLRASHSDWLGTESAAHAFALEHGSRPLFTWAPQHHDEQFATQTAYNLQVLDASGRPVWRSGKVESTEPRAVYPASAPPLRAATTFTWTVSTFDGSGRQSLSSARAAFHVALSPGDWSNVSWLGDGASNLFRATLPAVEEDVASAVLYVAGLDFSVVSLDGKPLNTLVTSPWTNTARVVGYSSYDLTATLRGGDAATHQLVVAVGIGWRDNHTFTVRDGDDRGKQGEFWRLLRAKIVTTSADGTQRTLTHTGDGTWQAAKGPSTYDSVYNGETYDARVAARLDAAPSASGGATAGGPAAGLWSAAATATGPTGAMVAWSVPPVRVLATIPPVSITNPYPNIHVVDFGIRRAGVVRLKGLSCAAGHTLVLRHAEILQHDGLPDLRGHVDPKMIYVGNLRTAKQTDTYTCAGSSGGETWAPGLTYHGFRFVEINTKGAADVASQISAEHIEMVHFASAVEQKATVRFSSTTLNRIHAMAVGSQRSNLMTVPTDCDQRDERLGWMGDANLSGESMLMNFDAAAFFGWWVRHVAMPELGADGSVPDVAPFYRYGGRPGDPSWSTALPTVIYQLWRVGGDLGTYQDVGGAAVAGQLASLGAQAAKGLDQMHTPYGDWCPPPAKIGGGQGVKPSMALTSAFSYINLVQQAAALATAAGNASAAKSMAALNRRLLAAYNAAWLKGGGTYDTGTQTALALALAIGAPPDANATRAALLSAIANQSTHSYAGIIGSSRLFPQLGAAGKHDTALAILSQTSYPSFGYGFANALEKTTTNLWELYARGGEHRTHDCVHAPPIAPGPCPALTACGGLTRTRTGPMRRGRGRA